MCPIVIINVAEGYDISLARITIGHMAIEDQGLHVRRFIFIPAFMPRCEPKLCCMCAIQTLTSMFVSLHKHMLL